MWFGPVFLPMLVFMSRIASPHDLMVGPLSSPSLQWVVEQVLVAQLWSVAEVVWRVCVPRQESAWVGVRHRAASHTGCVIGARPSRDSCWWRPSPAVTHLARETGPHLRPRKSCKKPCDNSMSGGKVVSRRAS